MLTKQVPAMDFINIGQSRINSILTITSMEKIDMNMGETYDCGIRY